MVEDPEESKSKLYEVSSVYPGKLLELQAKDILRLTPEAVKQLPLPLQYAPVSLRREAGTPYQARDTGVCDAAQDDPSTVPLRGAVDRLQLLAPDIHVVPWLVLRAPAVTFADLLRVSTRLIGSIPDEGIAYWVYPKVGKEPTINGIGDTRETEEALRVNPGTALVLTRDEALAYANLLCGELQEALRPLLGRGLSAAVGSPESCNELLRLYLRVLPGMPEVAAPICLDMTGYSCVEVVLASKGGSALVQSDDTVREIREAITRWANRLAWLPSLDSLWLGRLQIRRTEIVRVLEDHADLARPMPDWVTGRKTEEKACRKSRSSSRS